jgi:hypothetical protein
MEKRLNKISNIIDLLPNTTKTNKPIINKIIEKIKLKHEILDKYKFISEPEQLTKGDFIRYVDLGNTKLSFPYIISEIIYDISPSNIKHITNIAIFNSKYKTYIKINPKKYYIFKLDRTYNKLRGLLDKILSEEIEIYKKKNNI